MLKDGRTALQITKMKRKIFIISITILIVGVGYCIYEIFDFANGMRQDKVGGLNRQTEMIGIYYIDLPAGLDTLEFKANIRIDKSKKIHKIKFPNGGTETNVYIYDSTYFKNIQNNSKLKIEPLIHGFFKIDQEVLLDITNL